MNITDAILPTPFAAWSRRIALFSVQLVLLGFMSAIAAVLFIFLMILYFRLLGRLMWFTQSARRKVEESSPV